MRLGCVYHEVYFEERNFYICAKSHEDVHGHARPNLSRRTMLNPPSSSKGSVIPAVWRKLKANFQHLLFSFLSFILVWNQKYYLSTLCFSTGISSRANFSSSAPNLLMFSVTTDTTLTSKTLSVPYCLELFTSIYLYFVRHYLLSNKFLIEISTILRIVHWCLSWWIYRRRQ